MKTILITLLTISISASAYSQTEKNILRTYEEFKENKPSEFADFHLKKRTGFNIFMMGGIANYRLKKIEVDDNLEKVNNEIWGIFVDSSSYINSFPYSQISGFNKIIENGYYSYFIGEPARFKDKQITLGIIGPDEPQRAVCCKTSYVILPNGDVKWLTLNLLSELINDNKKLAEELKNDYVLQEDAYIMFDYLSRYNKMKK
jgi:hypothetical protein